MIEKDLRNFSLTRRKSVPTLSDSYEADSAANRVIKRVERGVGPDALVEIYLEFRDEDANNVELSGRYGISLFDVVVLRAYPWVILKHLTAKRKHEPAVILSFRRSA
jgi:hypothetical protein